MTRILGRACALMFISLPVVVLPVSSDCLSFAGIAVDFPTAVFIMKIMKMRMVV